MDADRPAIELKGVGQIGLYVNDLEAAARFYGEVLGLPESMRIPGSVFFDCGGVRLMLGQRGGDAAGSSPHPAAAGPGTIVYYEVADLEAAHRVLQSRGTRIVREPHLVARLPDHDLRMLFAEDPAGHLFALMSRVVRRDGAGA